MEKRLTGAKVIQSARKNSVEPEKLASKLKVFTSVKIFEILRSIC